MRVRNLSKCSYAAEGNGFEAPSELGASRTLMTGAGWECRGQGKVCPERGHSWWPSESSPSFYYLQTSGKALSPGLIGVTWGPRDRELMGEMWPAPKPGRKQRRGSPRQRQSRDPPGPAAQTGAVWGQPWMDDDGLRHTATWATRETRPELVCSWCCQWLPGNPMGWKSAHYTRDGGRAELLHLGRR